MYHLKERIVLQSKTTTVDAGGGRINGTTTSYPTVANVKPDNSNWNDDGLQRRIGQSYKVTIRKRDDYTPKIGDSITWRGQVMTINAIKLKIEQRQFWQFKASVLYGQS